MKCKVIKEDISGLSTEDLKKHSKLVVTPVNKLLSYLPHSSDNITQTFLDFLKSSDASGVTALSISCDYQSCAELDIADALLDTCLDYKGKNLKEIVLFCHNNKFFNIYYWGLKRRLLIDNLKEQLKDYYNEPVDHIVELRGYIRISRKKTFLSPKTQVKDILHQFCSVKFDNVRSCILILKNKEGITFSLDEQKWDILNCAS